MTTTYVITGANRAVGRGIADIILTRPNITLFALVRNPSHGTSQSLVSASQEKGADCKAVLIKYDASDPTSAELAMEEIKSVHGLTSLDVVIANAGFVAYAGPSVKASPSDYIDHFTANTLGPLTLFGATAPLLQRSSDVASIASEPANSSPSPRPWAAPGAHQN